MKKIYSLILSVIFTSGFYSQSLSVITPSSANQGETLNVTITGQNTSFSQASSSSLSIYFEFSQSSSTISVTNIAASDNYTLTATISIPEDEAVGDYNLFVYNNIDQSLTLENGFSVSEPSSSVILFEDFETASVGGSWPNGWTVEGTGEWTLNDPSTGTPNYGGAATIVESTGTTASSGNCTNVYAVVDSDGLGNGNTQSTSLVSPSFDLSSVEAATLEFNHSHRIYQSSEVYVESSTDNGNSWDNLASYLEDSYGPQLIDVTSLCGNSAVKIRFRYEGSWEYWYAVDDIAISSISCGQPTNLTASNVNSSSATISWDPGAEASTYNVEYGPAGFTLGSGTQENVSTTEYTMTSLSSQTEYDVYVQSDCGSSGSSNLAGPFTFSTPPSCGETVSHCYGVGAYTVFTAVVDNPGDFIKLDIIAGETEVGYDSLQIWDGVGNTGNLLYSADGDCSGGSGLSSTGSITLYVKGDGNYNCQDGLGGPYATFEVDITCITPSPVDMELTALTMETIVVAGANNVTGTVTNYGSDPISSFDITWNDGSGANTETVNVNLNFGETYDFTHGIALNAVAGETYDIEVVVTANGDADESNNTLSTTVSTVSSLVTKVVVGEEKNW
jgi:hypothetical protein